MFVGSMRVSSDSDCRTTDLQRDAFHAASLRQMAAGDTTVGFTPISNQCGRLITNAIIPCLGKCPCENWAE